MKWLLTTSEHSRNELPHYLDWVRGGGIEATLVLPGEPLPEAGGFDALLLTGGGDIDPARYGQSIHPGMHTPQPERDELEFRLLEVFHGLRKPVLGICRGLQAAQVFFGGTLIQHVPALINPTMERHSRRDEADSTHPLVWLPGAAMSEALGRRADRCNSSHHQAANPAELAASLRIAGVSPAGIVEALESAEDNAPFVSCVQWHPERMNVRDTASGGLRDYWTAEVRRRA